MWRPLLSAALATYGNARFASRARLASATSRSCRAFLIASVQAGPRQLPRSFEGLVSLRIQTQKVSLFGLHITSGT